MSKGPWFDAIIKGLGRTEDGFTMSEGSKTGPDGKKSFTLYFDDPIRNGGFSVGPLPDDATDEQVTTAVRKGWQTFIRAHPVTRGANI